jgi:hypothetical protein
MYVDSLVDKGYYDTIGITSFIGSLNNEVANMEEIRLLHRFLHIKRASHYHFEGNDWHLYNHYDTFIKELEAKFTTLEE